MFLFCSTPSPFLPALPDPCCYPAGTFPVKRGKRLSRLTYILGKGDQLLCYNVMLSRYCAWPTHTQKSRLVPAIGKNGAPQSQSQFFPTALFRNSATFDGATAIAIRNRNISDSEKKGGNGNKQIRLSFFTILSESRNLVIGISRFEFIFSALAKKNCDCDYLIRGR